MTTTSGDVATCKSAIVHLVMSLHELLQASHQRGHTSNRALKALECKHKCCQKKGNRLGVTDQCTQATTQTVVHRHYIKVISLCMAATFCRMIDDAGIASVVSSYHILSA
jgi:hypothetical protein